MDRLNGVFYLPEKFFRKENNEPFIQKVMASVLNKKEWIQGDPNKFEPDYFCEGLPFEFTIASDTKKKKNFIQNLGQGDFSSNDVESDALQYITESIEKKVKKNYSVDGVHLCVLCLLSIYPWVSDAYASPLCALFNYRYKCFLEKLKTEYIDTETFNNIFIIFPDSSARWCVQDVRTSNKGFYILSEEEKNEGQTPYIMSVNEYKKMIEIEV